MVYGPLKPLAAHADVVRQLGPQWVQRQTSDALYSVPMVETHSLKMVKRPGVTSKILALQCVSIHQPALSAAETCRCHRCMLEMSQSPVMSYTEKALNAWHRQGTQKTGNTYNQHKRPLIGTTHRPSTIERAAREPRRITPTSTNKEWVKNMITCTMASLCVLYPDG